MTTSRRALVSLALLASGCARGATASRTKAPGDDDAGAPNPGTPVEVAPVARRTLRVTVSGPGRTATIEQQNVRAPFAGVLETMKVQDGDRVAAHQVIGTVVSENSHAALVGARAMAAAAHTPAARRDAARALALAKRNLVATPLRAPEAGVVVKHTADEGALVTQQEDIVSIAALDSFVFIAEIVQSDLPRIRPGQAAELHLSARRSPLHGVVHVVLPAGSSKDLSTPVRIDLPRREAPIALDLFGTAVITVGEHRDATVVPAAAVLRDDVTGISRVAEVAPGDRARWVEVKPGLAEGGVVEILAPPLAVGQRVIVAGQVGLPEGAPVRPTANLTLRAEPHAPPP